jgi:hypothetical protein
MSAGRGLRAVLESAQAEAGCSAADLTVLSTPVGPYRLDTPTGRAEGTWLAGQMDRLGLESRQIHLRGLHYALVSTAALVKPNGEPYRNTEKDWLWLQSSAAKAARWLGFVPFDAIVDERNAAPVIRVRPATAPSVEIGLGAEVEINVPDLEDIRPTVYLDGFGARQAFHLVLTGEKTSLADVVAPIAERYDADLYLPSGEISDTLVYQMAKTGAADGRPMIVLVMADFDPAGRQMAVSIARKLQGFRDLHFPGLGFEVHAIALNEDQVRELRLPSTPLKETERRADRWRLEFGLEQTEIDALATLRPDALRRIVQQAIAPFYDSTLDRRTREARLAFVDAAQSALDARVDSDLIEALHAEAEAKLATIRAEIDAINDQLRSATDTLGIHLTPPEPPEPELPDRVKGKPIIDSAWSWVEQTRALKRRKSYGNGGGEHDR